MVIRTNKLSANTYRQLNENETQLSKSLKKLSTGYQINSGADNSSGLAISEKMKAQIAGLSQAESNVLDNISFVQTMDGALGEDQSMLNRMIALAEKAANGTIRNSVDREALQQEVHSLDEEITRISISTQYNGIPLRGLDPVAKLTKQDGLDGTTSSPTRYELNFSGTSDTLIGGKEIDGQTLNWDKDITTTLTQFVAAYNNDSTKHYTASVQSEILTLTNKEDGPTEIDPSNTTSIQYTKTQGVIGTSTRQSTVIDFTGKIGKILIGGGFWCDEALLDSSTFYFHLFEFVDMGTDKSTSVYELSNQYDESGSLVSKKYGVPISEDATGVEIAKAVADAICCIHNKDTWLSYNQNFFSENGIVKINNCSAGKALYGLNKGDTPSLLYTDPRVPPDFCQYGGGLRLQIGDTNQYYDRLTFTLDEMSSYGLGIENLDVSTQDNATAAINKIKDAINKVSKARGQLGALANRLEHAAKNMAQTSENLSAANSTIKDTDMAKEMSNYIKTNILVDSAQAMLSQANQQPQSILQLLK